MAQHYSFPTLDEQEVIDVFAELQIPLTKESLTKPPQGFMRDLYERCLSMLTGIRREAITCRNLAATQCLSDPGLYDDTIPEIQFFRELRGLMETVGIIDFSRRDIDKPVKERTIRILSAVINFAKFRLDKMDQIEEFEEQLENLLEDRQVLVEGNGQAVLVIDRSNSEREEVRPQVEAMERETLELESVLKTKNTEQEDLQKESRVLKEQTSHIQERVDSSKLEILNLRQENEKLNLQIVHSPEKLKAHLEEMERSFEEATQQKLEGEERLRQVQTKGDALAKTCKEVQKCASMLEEVGQEMTKSNELKTDTKEMQSGITAKEEQIQEMQTQQQHLQRELQLAQERLQRLNVKKAAVQETAERQLNTAQHEMGLLAQERDAAKAQFDQGAQFVQAMTAKTQQMTEKHEAEKQAMEGQLGNLVSELERYHSSLFQAMSAGTVA